MGKAAGPAVLSSGAAWANAPKSPVYTPDCNPDWLAIASPSPGTSNTRLSGVAAVAANDAWAVGYYYSATKYQTLILHWDGSAWTQTPSPNVGTDNNYLNAITVVSAADIWAVGYYVSGANMTPTLILHWDGSAWSVVPSPSVAASFNNLASVDARAANDIWTAGYAVQNSIAATLILHWDGSAWTQTPSPNVGTSHNNLSGVTAVSATDVWAVGSYHAGTTDQTLIQHWDGLAWSVTPSPNVGTESNYLRGVDGVAANDLWAVGFYYVGGLRQTYILHWNGSMWSATPSPNPGIDHTLQGMVAVAANDVWAVGAYEDNLSVNRTLILHWNGSGWSTTSSANVGTNANFLTGITAVAANDLWTVGGYNNGVEQTLVERYALCPATATPTPGTPAPTHTLTPIPTVTPIPSSPTPVATECVPSWTVETSPNVGSSDNQLRAVAAIAADDIWAVGYSGDNTVGFQSLTMHWDGHTWSVVPSPNPSSYLNFLDGVTAIASDDVWAVGTERFTAFDGHTLIMHWDGHTWSVIPSPNADQGLYNYLNGVSATSANDVWAVGFYETFFDSLTLTMHWDGSAWSLVPSPNTNPTYNYLYAVEAISANDVWAVGFFTTTADHSLALHWDGSAWDVVAVPNMGSADNHLYAVNAIAPDDIWAVGLFVEYNGPSRLEHTLTTHWDGSNWSVVPSPDVGTQTNTLNGVAALAINDVWAVGSYNSSGDQSLTEHWDGTAWSVVPSPSVGGRTWLLGVAALASDDVWSVGLHDNLYRTLTEHYRSPCGAPMPTVTSTPTGTATPTATGTPPLATATPTVCAISFTDVPPGSTFYPYIQCLACRGIVSGYPDGTFRPGFDVTRGQAAKIVANSADYQDPIPSGQQTFNDVPPGSTFWVYIERVALHGAVSGYPCGGPGEPCPGAYYRPNNALTRGQLAKIDSEVFGYSDPIPAERQTFNDVPPGSTFWLYTERLALHAVINGYPCGGVGEPCPGMYYRAGNNITRGQVAKVVANTFFPQCQSLALH